MHIERVDQLYELRRQVDLPLVRLSVGQLKRRNVLRYALKYALWAVRVGGRIEITDDGPAGFDISPHTMPFSIVRQQCFKTLKDDVDLLELDDRGLRLVFERRKPIPAAGWSAGIIFSGNPNEVPVLEKAVAGLQRQPELAPAACGQIMVCGPTGAAELLSGLPRVQYVPFDESTSQRAFTTRKKNALIAAASNPRIAVAHARVVLTDGCLAAFAREFDVSGSRVEYHENGRKVPYIDWIVTDLRDGDVIPRQLQSSLYYDRSRYLDQLRGGGRPFVDGGIFFAMTDVARDVTLSPNLAWGEAEDVEWCERLQTHGYLVDLNPDALAVSQSFKLSRRMVDYPVLSSRSASVRRLLRRAGSVLKGLGSR